MKKRIVVASALGLGGSLIYLVARAIKAGKQKIKSDREDDRDKIVIDDRGTSQVEATTILKNIRDHAFDGSDERLALALGRPEEEIESWTSGIGTIDGDVV